MGSGLEQRGVSRAAFHFCSNPSLRLSGTVSRAGGEINPELCLTSYGHMLLSSILDGLSYVYGLHNPLICIFGRIISLLRVPCWSSPSPPEQIKHPTDTPICQLLHQSDSHRLPDQIACLIKSRLPAMKKGIIYFFYFCFLSHGFLWKTEWV